MFVLLAEMGDKTQLLAMAFAVRYSAWKVLLAVFLATLINHALAVLTGHYLTKVIPVDIISFLTALSFIVFGLWTIRGDKLEGEDKKKSRFGPVITVAIAFFFAEMGDKTQLATIALAVEYRNMLSVLIGTTSAMVIADAIGIIIGIVMRKHIPERLVKWISAIIFILFGLLSAYKILSARLDLRYTFIAMGFLMLCTAYGIFYIVRLGFKRNRKT